MKHDSKPFLFLILIAFVMGCTGEETPTQTPLTTIPPETAAPHFPELPPLTPPACKDGETKNATCPDGVTDYLAENCVKGEWHTVMYIRNPCEPIPKTTSSTTTLIFCTEGETKTATCPDGVTTYLNENCVDGEWHQVMYIRNPCEPIATTTSSTTTSTTTIKDPTVEKTM
jgi:hypothetical protein